MTGLKIDTEDKRLLKDAIYGELVWKEIISENKEKRGT